MPVDWRHIRSQLFADVEQTPHSRETAMAANVPC